MWLLGLPTFRSARGMAWLVCAIYMLGGLGRSLSPSISSRPITRHRIRQKPLIPSRLWTRRVLPLGILSGIGFIGAGTIPEARPAGYRALPRPDYVVLSQSSGCCPGGGRLVSGLAVAVTIGVVILGWLEWIGSKDAPGTDRLSWLKLVLTGTKLCLKIWIPAYARWGFHVVSWSAGSGTEGRLTCEIRWKARDHESGVPDFVRQISQHRDIVSYQWRKLDAKVPRTGYCNGSWPETVPDRTMIPDRRRLQLEAMAHMQVAFPKSPCISEYPVSESARCNMLSCCFQGWSLSPRRECPILEYIKRTWTDSDAVPFRTWLWRRRIPSSVLRQAAGGRCSISRTEDMG